MQAHQPSDMTLHFVEVALEMPKAGTECLVRAWSEDGIYFYALAIYVTEVACKRWAVLLMLNEKEGSNAGPTLWFEPREWAALPRTTQLSGKRWT